MERNGRSRWAKPARWLATHAPDAERVVRSDSLLLQLALVKLGVGVALVPEPSLTHYGLVALKVSAALRDACGWPRDELFLVTHRALRRVPRVEVVWDLLVARVGARLRAARRRDFVARSGSKREVDD